MDKKQAIASINKYGKIGNIISKVLLVILGISAVLTIVGSIALRALPEEFVRLNIENNLTLEVDIAAVDPDVKMDEINKAVDVINDGNFDAGLNMGAVHFSLNQAEVVDGKLVASTNGSGEIVSLHSLADGVLIAGVAVLLAFISVFFASKLCKAFQVCESPFEENVIKSMKNFAISLIPWALFSSVPESYMNSILGNGLKFSISLDMNVIFTVLIILMLTVVFKYGAQLQQESDETL